MAIQNIDKCQFKRLLTFTLVLMMMLSATEVRAQPSIRWEPFALESHGGHVEGAELGRLTVPERRAAPNRTIEIAFVRIKTTSTNPGAPLIYLDGGPGGPGYTLVRA